MVASKVLVAAPRTSRLITRCFITYYPIDLCGMASNTDEMLTSGNDTRVPSSRGR